MTQAIVDSAAVTIDIQVSLGYVDFFCFLFLVNIFPGKLSENDLSHKVE